MLQQMCNKSRLDSKAIRRALMQMLILITAVLLTLLL